MLLLHHPHLAKFTCADCKTYVYDMKTGEPELFNVDQKMRRNTATPCSQCPRKSPEEEKYSRLSAKNRKTLKVYLEARASHGTSLHGYRIDPILAHNLAVLDLLFRAFEREQATEAMTSGLMTITALTMPHRN